MSRAILEAEAARLAAKSARYGAELSWAQNEFSEILPFPTPLSLSLLRLLAGHDGATGHVCRTLGMTYDPAVPIDDYLETVFGRTFVNLAAERQLAGTDRPPGFLRKLNCAVRLRRQLPAGYGNFVATVKAFTTHYQEQAGVHLDRLSVAELRDRSGLLAAGLARHYQCVVEAGLLARFCLDLLATRVGEGNLAPLLAVAWRQLPAAPLAARDIFVFREQELAGLAGFGAEIDYELACPRNLETGLTPTPLAGGRGAAPPPASGKIFRKAGSTLLMFKVYESLKLIYKTLLLRELYLLRQAILEYDRRSAANGDTFYLHLEELLARQCHPPAGEIARRRKEAALFAQVAVPTSVKLADLPAIVQGALQADWHPLQGKSVNGRAFAGRVVVCKGRTDIERADAGCILVVKQASPDLVAAIGRTGGIIAETGGLLSHLAIVAREHGFPMVLQVRDATALLADGIIIAVAGDGTITLQP